MKTTETQQKILDFIEKFNDTTAELISSGTGMNKLHVFKTVKVLAENNLIKISESNPPTYEFLKAEIKNEKPDQKKTIKSPITKNITEDEVALKSDGRDTSKLKFNGELYGKGRLVLAVVKKYVEDNPRTTITKLKEIFPDELNKKYGCIQTVEKARKISVDRERFFLKAEDLIKVGDKKVAVCNQFGSHNLPLKHFRSLGFTIK